MILALAVLALSVYSEASSKPIIADSTSGDFLVVSEPQLRGDSQFFVARSIQNNLNYELRAGQFPTYQIGDLLYIEGTPKIIKKNDPLYRASRIKGVVATISYPEIIFLGEAEWSVGDFFVLARRYLIRVRQKLTKNISQIIPEPESGLLNGIIFGERSDFSEKLSSAFSRVGLTHIVALSGYNITIVIAFLSLIVSRGNKRSHLLFCISGILIFVLATGLSASVIRAAIMGSVFLLAGFWGRKPDGLVAIIFAATVMAILNPAILVYDIGFQLSFAAMLGMILLVPLMSSGAVFSNPLWGSVLAGTVSAQLFTWPIISANFGVVSIIAPLSNLLVLPVIPITMATGFGVSLISLFSPSLASLISFVPWLFVAYISKITQVLSGYKYAAISVKVVSPVIIVGYYLLLIDFILLLKYRHDHR
jgi:competence protein ComEC